MAISVKLPVFEGPLDLLLHLIEKNKIDIYDIPVAKITDQYLEYVHQMDHEDMDVTSEFLVMAATLLDIKSRMLLPREVDSETGEEEADPREELVRRLLEYKMYKYLSEELSVCREQAGVRYFRSRNLPREVRSYQPPIDYGQLLKGTDLNSLQKVFGEVLRRKKSRRDPIRSGFGKILPEEVNIETKSLYIRAYLRVHPRTDFRALLESQKSREEVIVTFLILLELMKTQKVRIAQDSIGGKILIETVPTDRAPAAGEASPEEAAEAPGQDPAEDTDAPGQDEKDDDRKDEDKNELTADGLQADKEPWQEDAVPEEEQTQDIPADTTTGREQTEETPVNTDESQPEEVSVIIKERTEKESRPRNSSVPLLAFRDAKVIEAAVPLPLPSLTQTEVPESLLFQNKIISAPQERDVSVLEEADAPILVEENAPILEEADAPVLEEPDAPVLEEPDTPLLEVADAPIPEEADAPVLEEPDTPVLEEADAPIPEEADAPILEGAEVSVLQETESCPEACPAAALPHFSDRLWHGKLPRYSGSGGRRGFGPGAAPSPSFRGYTGSRRMRGEDPAWEQKRLMRRWGHL